MEIVGLGTHVIECVRVSEMIHKHAERFIMRVFTDAESQFCRERTHSTEYYAAIWAGKDSVFRAMGLKTNRATPWHEVEIRCETKVTPVVIVSGSTGNSMRELGITKILLTFSYSRHYATATAIAVH